MAGWSACVAAALAFLLPTAHAKALTVDCYETSEKLCTGRLISVLAGDIIILEYKNLRDQIQISRVRLTGWVPCFKCPPCDKAINNSKATLDALRALIGETVSFKMPRYRYDNAGRSEMEEAMVLDRSGDPAINTLIRLGLYCPTVPKID